MSDLNEEQTPQFEDFEPQEESSPPSAPAGGPNRNFLIAIGVIGGIFLLALIGMAVYAATVLPQSNARRATEAAQVYIQNTVTASAATQKAVSLAQVLTPSSTPPATATLPAPTNTPVIAQPTATATLIPTEEITGGNKAETPDPTLLAQMTADPQVGGGAAEATLSPAQARTATLAVLLTQAAGQVGGLAPTPTALPATGFADEVGLPGLFGLALGLLVLTFLARGLRASTR